MALSDAVHGNPGDGDAPARGDLAPADGSATAPSPVRGVSRRSTSLSGVTTIWYSEHHPGGRRRSTRRASAMDDATVNRTSSGRGIQNASGDTPATRPARIAYMTDEKV